jgi:hypothetical protein
MGPLKNRKHEAFAREIAALTPPATAYAAAGFKGDPRWHRYNASKLAHKPHVQARIAELGKQFEEMAGIHAAYIQHKLLPLIEANAAELFERDENGKERLRPITELPRELTAAIAKIKCDADTGRVTEIALHDKTATGNVLLRSVGALFDMHQHKHQHDVGPGLADRLNAARQRVAARLASLSHDDQMVLIEALEAIPDDENAEKAEETEK